MVSTIDTINELLGNGQHTEAAILATQELSKYPNSVPLLLARAQAFTRDHDTLEEAVTDAERACAYGNEEEKSDAQLRRAICFYKMKEYGKAKALVSTFGHARDQKTAEVWKALIESKDAAPAEPSDVQIAVVDKPRESAAVASPRETGARTDWYQSLDRLTLTVYHKNTPPDATIRIESQKVVIAHDNFEFSPALYQPVIPEKSSYDVTANKIEFVLAKATSQQWPQFAKIESDAKDDEPPKLRSKWDTLELSDDEDDKADDTNEFFRKLYKDASPEAQRAMMKSYVESNGTALSTNWDDVKKGKVPVYPPDGMEVKKF